MKLFVALALLWGAPAMAGKCDYLVKKSDTAKGSALVKAYGDLLKCDAEVANASYDSFMIKAGEVGVIVDLAMVALDANAFSPVWESLEKIPDYSARDEIAKGVGAKCAEDEHVLPFIKGAYYGLRSRQFGQWEDALLTCDAPELVSWMQDVVAKPPSSPYDEKYSAVIGAFVKRQRAKALPVLQRAAVEAGNAGGPFNTILEQMDSAVAPAMGQDMKPGDKDLLEKAMVKVASAVVPEQAALVADRLYNAGAEKAAASLLPQIYPDRVQGGGKMLYGAAGLESCKKEMIIHYAAVSEPSKRWSILADVKEPVKAFKPRLKCEASWDVLATPDPIASKGKINAWVDGLVEQWEGKGYSVKTREEKTITLD